MKENETTRLEEFFRNQADWGPGTRVSDGPKTGFIIDWNIKNTFPLSGNFSIFYDDGDYREYDAFYFRYIRGVIHPVSRFQNNPETVNRAYKKYCENLFLGKLKDEY